ncbi:hypothetical protein ELS83_14355 [Marinifilum sp. JC070]|uniref:Uncharacterized protein n=1 Tax=Marinifilum caeruleilacunae TaxID=2499076 RepID=A0ABX1WY13_9BACT|nr:hypothetical protein [Marinifilum caeruleilacunae]
MYWHRLRPERASEKMGTFPVLAKFAFGFVLGIVVESPERSEDLQRIARPEGEHPNIKKIIPVNKCVLRGAIRW